MICRRAKDLAERSNLKFDRFLIVNNDVNISAEKLIIDRISVSTVCEIDLVKYEGDGYRNFKGNFTLRLKVGDFPSITFETGICRQPSYSQWANKNY